MTNCSMKLYWYDAAGAGGTVAAMAAVAEMAVVWCTGAVGTVRYGTAVAVAKKTAVARRTALLVRYS